MAPLNSTRACRKYIDLIQGISGKYPNWNPHKRIEVGDFGRIDPENGQFICEGNIYRDEPLASIAKDYPPVIHDPEYEHKVDTSFLTCLTRPPDFRDLSDIVYKRQWKFTEDRTGFLVLYRSRMISIPDSFLDMALRDDNPIPDIRTKNVVTNLWMCPAFAMYMSNKSNEHVKIALRAPDAGSGQETGWYAEGNVGLYQFGSLANGNYLPLFQLQKIRKRSVRPRRDGRDPNEIIWAFSESPWHNLDDDGAEVPSDQGEWMDDGDDEGDTESEEEEE